MTHEQTAPGRPSRPSALQHLAEGLDRIGLVAERDVAQALARSYALAGERTGQPFGEAEQAALDDLCAAIRRRDEVREARHLVARHANDLRAGRAPFVEDGQEDEEA